MAGIKLIEVALPLEPINREAVRDNFLRDGHPRTLHLWWARRPLAVCRAVLFAQLVDDPSGYVDALLEDPEKRLAVTRELERRRKLWEESLMRYEEALARGERSIPEPGPEPWLEDCAADLER